MNITCRLPGRSSTLLAAVSGNGDAIGELPHPHNPAIHAHGMDLHFAGCGRTGGKQPIRARAVVGDEHEPAAIDLAWRGFARPWVGNGDLSGLMAMRIGVVWRDRTQQYPQCQTQRDREPCAAADQAEVGGIFVGNGKQRHGSDSSCFGKRRRHQRGQLAPFIKAEAASEFERAIAPFQEQPHLGRCRLIGEQPQPERR